MLHCEQKRLGSAHKFFWVTFLWKSIPIIQFKYYCIWSVAVKFSHSSHQSCIYLFNDSPCSVLKWSPCTPVHLVSRRSTVPNSGRTPLLGCCSDWSLQVAECWRVSIIRAFAWETLAVYRKWPEHQLHSAIMTRLVVGVFLAKILRMTISGYPVYLPDLTPCDLWHFQNWRLLWKARDFQTLSEFRDVPCPSWWAFQKGLEGFLETFYTVETPPNHVQRYARRPFLRQQAVQ